MRHIPLAVAAVLAATTATGAAVKIEKLQQQQRRSVGQRSGPIREVVAVRDASIVDDEPRVTVTASPDGGPLTEARVVHGGARHTDRADGVAPLAPRLLWQRDLGGAIEAQLTVSPDGRTLYASTLGGQLTALASRDGEIRWSLSLADRAYATPCVADDGTIYAASDAKRMFAVTAGGKIKWKFDTEDEADTSPAIAPDGTLVFAAGRMVYDLSPQGAIAWRFSAKRKIFTAPAIDAKGRVFVGSQDHHAYGLASDGHALWSDDLDADVDGAPAIGDDGGVFFGTDHDEIVRVEPEDGRVSWRSNVGGYVRGTLSVARNGDVVAGVYGPTPGLVRVRAADGVVVFRLAVPGTGARDFGVHGGALEDGSGKLIFGAQDDEVRAVTADGALLWAFATGGDVDAPITVLRDGTLIIASDDGVVRALGSIGSAADASDE